MKNNEKLYKTYHRNYQGIEELYDDLRDSVLNISLENKRIILYYNSDTLWIERASWGYNTYFNGKKERGEWEDQDIYFYALEFVHEQAVGISELELNDTSIIALNDRGITYADEFGRTHFIEYAACALNGPTETCVGERDITKRYFTFYTPGVPTKVLFLNLFVPKKNHVLFGGRQKRFGAVRQAVFDSGYTSYDLS